MALILLLSTCLAMINAARGAGVKNTKEVEIVAFALVAYVVTCNAIAAAIFWIPIGLEFAIGTGQWMGAITKDLGMNWRVWEMLSVFVYSLLFLTTWMSLGL